MNEIDFFQISIDCTYSGPKKYSYSFGDTKIMKFQVKLMYLYVGLGLDFEMFYQYICDNCVQYKYQVGAVNFLDRIELKKEKKGATVKGENRSILFTKFTGKNRWVLL